MHTLRVTITKLLGTAGLAKAKQWRLQTITVSPHVQHCRTLLDYLAPHQDHSYGKHWSASRKAGFHPGMLAFSEGAQTVANSVAVMARARLHLVGEPRVKGSEIERKLADDAVKDVISHKSSG